MSTRRQVMKFGGTSVANAECIARAAKIIADSARKGRCVAVVSAMSGVTNQLIDAAKTALTGNANGATAVMDALRAQHETALTTLVKSEEERGRVRQKLEAVLAEGRRFCEGTALLRELSPRTLDAISSLGERLSAPLIAAAVRELGLASEAVEATELIVTDEFHGGAEPQMDHTREKSQARILPLLARGIVPVVTGFLGATPSGELTTLGRGGSDYSATILGAALDADEVIIWTDVDGVLTADPRLVTEAQTIPEISYREAAELAYFGAKVLHPATVLPAIQKNIPVYVLNSRNPSCEGTRITTRAPHSKNIFKAIAAKKKITIVDVAAPRMLLAHGFLKSIFEAFDRHKVAIDVVSTSEVSVSLTVDSNQAIPALAADLAKLADVKYEGRKAIVCLVGENLRDTPGIAALVFRELADKKIRMISQGASEINLTFVIEEDEVPDVIQRLHKTFFAELDHETFA